MNRNNRLQSSLSLVIANLAVAGVYFATARLGLVFGRFGDYASLVWPSSGVALAGVVIFGYRLSPGVFLGAFLAILKIGSPWPVASAMAAGNALEAVTGAYLLRRAGFDRALERVRDVLKFVLLAAVSGTAVSAVVGAFTLWAGKLIAPHELLRAGLTWWLGDATGTLVVGSVFLVWYRSPSRIEVPRRFAEAVVLATALLLASLVAFYGWLIDFNPLYRFLGPYLLFPFVVWIALRFGQRGVTASVLLIAALSICSAFFDHGPLWDRADVPDPISFQLYAGVLAVTMMVLAAAVCEQRRALISLKQREDSLARYAADIDAMFELAGSAHIQVDVATAKLARVSRKFCAITGYEQEELRDMNLAAIQHPDDRVFAVQEVGRMLRGQIRDLSFETRYFRKDGATAWVHVTVTLMREDHGKTRIMAIVHDVTMRKQAEALLLSAKEAAEAATRAKSAFVANVSHEIRTPLGAMLGFTELLLNPRQAPSDRMNCAMTIKRNGELLARIIDDLLDLSKIEADRLEIEKVRFSLSDLIEDVVSLLSFRAREKGVTMTAATDGPIPRTIVSDPTRLRQILLNVVGNAVKFTERGSVEVVVKVASGADGRGARLEFIIRDTGRGLTPDQAQSLFQPFAQADSSMSRKYGGTGLGLFLAKRLAQALGGDLVLRDSVSGQGSTFLVTIDVGSLAQATYFERESTKKARVRTTGVPLAVSDKLRGTRILVVEDAPDNQVLLSRLLKHAGATVDVAGDGYSGMDRALTGAFDVVLMDIQMPGIDGHETTSRLRALGFRPPIIALTAHAMKDERERAARSGFSDYLTKPINREELIATVFRWTGRPRPLRRSAKSHEGVMLDTIVRH